MGKYEIDEFTYIGNLTTVLEQCQRVLNSQGLLAFSVERSEQPNYQLQTTIRYAHNKAYLESSLKQAGFKLITCKETTLRTQQKQPVIGYLVVAQKDWFLSYEDNDLKRLHEKYVLDNALLPYSLNDRINN